MTFTEAAAEVLRQVGHPLHYKEITAYAIEKSLLSHVGKSPEVTMGSRLAALFKKDSDDNPMLRIRPGVFALREWEASGSLEQMLAELKPQPRAGGAAEKAPKSVRGARAKAAAEDVTDAELAPARSEPLPEDEPEAVAVEVAAADADQPYEVVAEADVEPAEAHERPARDDSYDDAIEPARRAEAASVDDVSDDLLVEDEDADLAPVDVDEPTGAELGAGAYDDEDDDEQPLLAERDAAAPTDRESSRRRRRRRRRAKGGQDGFGGNGVAAGYSASPSDNHQEVLLAEPRATATSGGAHPVVLEVGAGSLDQLAIEDFGGKDMADAIAIVLGAFDRASGPVSLRQLAETAQRRGRLAGDLQQLQSQIAASVRADNVRRTAAGQRPRFRFVGGRVALTDWLLPGDLARYEHDAIAAVERYRDAARKAFVRKIQELPGHAFIELALLVLERIGFRNVRAVRRAGIPGNEAHFTALHDTGAGDILVALVLRRDGREVGRERVTELRGSLHHYGPAAIGWIITAGPVLSGAREEAATTNAAPVALLDGFGIARLCELHDVAVVRTSLPIAIPDLDVLEALRAS